VAHDLAIGGIAMASEVAYGGAASALISNDGAYWTHLTEDTWVGPALRFMPNLGWLSLLGIPGLYIAMKEMRNKRL
jgi:hypothetical protein